MEIVSYIKWNKPGEYDKLLSLMKTAKDETELRALIISEFNIAGYEADTIILRFRKKFISIKQKENE